MARGFDVANLKDKAHARAPADVEELHAALQRTHDSSLDTLLELRSDIAPIGKRLIASLILELEFHSTFPQRSPMELYTRWDSLEPRSGQAQRCAEPG